VSHVTVTVTINGDDLTIERHLPDICNAGELLPHLPTLTAGIDAVIAEVRAALDARYQHNRNR
jgi:hypothetical protein